MVYVATRKKTKPTFATVACRRCLSDATSSLDFLSDDCIVLVCMVSVPVMNSFFSVGYDIGKHKVK